MIALAAAMTALVHVAHADDVTCDTPGVAQMLVTDMFNENPAAQKLNLQAEKVVLLDARTTSTGRSCLVAVQTNHGHVLKYTFTFGSDGKAALDAAP